MNISMPEKLILAFVFLLLLLGGVLFLMNEALFLTYTQEDGFIEWITVIGLLLGSVVCFYRVVKLFQHKNWLFTLTNIALGLMLFFVAGEEISWGQRIFGIESSAYFQQHNTQGETNIHNLMVDHVKLNKIIFTFALIALLGIYLVIVPVVYHKSKAFKRFVDRAGAVIPRLYQIISFGVLFLLTSLIPHEKNPELLEFGAAFIFLLIILFPVNKHVLIEKHSG